jgi:hypothetical protein
MNNFVKGMGSFNLFPPQKPDKTGLENAWCKVAVAFAKTGTNMRTAIKFLDAQIQSSPPNMTYGK